MGPRLVRILRGDPRGLTPGEGGHFWGESGSARQNCPTELRQFLVTPSDAKIRIYFGTAKRGGKNWLGTPFRSQNLRLVHQLKIVSWKESCARMPGPKSGGLRKRFDGETKSITPGCLPQASGGRTACRPRQRLRRRSAKGGGCAVGGLGFQG